MGVKKFALAAVVMMTALTILSIIGAVSTHACVFIIDPPLPDPDPAIRPGDGTGVPADVHPRDVRRTAVLYLRCAINGFGHPLTKTTKSNSELNTG